MWKDSCNLLNFAYVFSFNKVNENRQNENNSAVSCTSIYKNSGLCV